jgi:hypothetical protein
MMRNERGIVTTEFIFSLVIAAGLSILLFSVSYTLAIVEVTQYVVFSAARAHLAANKDPNAQKEAAVAKFKQLTTDKSAIATVYNGTWFEIAKPDDLDVRGGLSADYGGKPSFGDDLAGGSDLRSWFLGVSAPFTPKIMNLNLPILGKTTEDGEDSFFKTRVNAMLIREPSQKECQTFFEKRRNALGQLPSAEKFYDPGFYVPVEDNGC